MTAAHVKHVRAALERHHGKLTAMTNAHHQAAAQAAQQRAELAAQQQEQSAQQQES